MTNKISFKWKLAQTLEYKWWQNYLKKKDASTYLSWKRKYWETLLSSLNNSIEIPVKKVILDAGCGPAGIFMALESNIVDALDPLLDKYVELPHFNAQNYPWTNFIHSPLESFNADKKYDLIFCMNAINHVNNIELCYDNMVDALKPGGYLIISTDAHRYTFLKKIFQKLPGDILHPVQLDIDEYNNLLTQRGLEIIQNTLYKQEKIFNYYITVARKLTA